MLHTIFLAVTNMSITASIVIIIVLFARFLLKGAPKIFSYALWAVVLFRLLCPISLTSDFSLMRIFRVPVSETGRIEYVSFGTDNTEAPAIIIPAPNINQATEQSPSQSLQETPTVNSFALPASGISILWICGIAAMLIFNTIQLMRFRRKLIGAIPLRGNIYIVDHIPTPFVMGLIRPKIYLPSSVSDTEQPYIIRHEQYHIHRGDHIVKLVAFVALCVHWLNPLVWIAFIFAGRDMEMSCDEAVMKQVDKDIRAD